MCIRKSTQICPLQAPVSDNSYLDRNSHNSTKIFVYSRNNHVRESRFLRYERYLV